MISMNDNHWTKNGDVLFLNHNIQHNKSKEFGYLEIAPDFDNYVLKLQLRGTYVCATYPTLKIAQDHAHDFIYYNGFSIVAGD